MSKYFINKFCEVKRIGFRRYRIEVTGQPENGIITFGSILSRQEVNAWKAGWEAAMTFVEHSDNVVLNSVHLEDGSGE